MAANRSIAVVSAGLPLFLFLASAHAKASGAISPASTAASATFADTGAPRQRRRSSAMGIDPDHPHDFSVRPTPLISLCGWCCCSRVFSVLWVVLVGGGGGGGGGDGDVALR